MWVDTAVTQGAVQCYYGVWEAEMFFVMRCLQEIQLNGKPGVSCRNHAYVVSHTQPGIGIKEAVSRVLQTSVHTV